MAYQGYNAGASEGVTVTLNRGTSDTGRIAILVYSQEAADGSLASSVTCSIGGQSCSQLFAITNTAATGGDTGIWAFWANESVLEAASSGDVTFTPSPDQGEGDDVSTAFLFTGRSQSAPTVNSATFTDTDNATVSASAAASNADLLGLWFCTGPIGITYAGDLTTEIYTYTDDSSFTSAYGAGLGSGSRAATFTLADIRTGVVGAIIMEAVGGGGASTTITDAGDETYTNGETGIVITGTNFGASQGTGTVKISPTDNVNDSNAVTQTVTSWSDTSVTFTAVRSTLPASTNLYLFVTSNGGYSNASGHVVSFNQVVTVTNVSDTTLMDGQTSVTITGTDFQSTQGTGRVVISPTNSISDVNAVAQTVTSWADTSITFTAARSSLSFSTNLYLFVENDDDVSNATGYTVQFTGTKKLRVAVAPAAAGVSGVYGVVWAEPPAASSPNAGYTFDATGEKLETTGQLALTDHPFTMFCWIKVADGTPASTQTAFSIGNSAYGSDRYCSLQLTAADGYARALAYHTTSSSSTTASNGCANNTWYAIAGLFDRNVSSQVTSVQAWSWNGTNESLSTAVTGLTKQMSTFNLNRVGMSRTGTGELQGLVAHVAVWNRLLTAGELTQLRTQLPSTVATSNLIAYWPLTADANAVVGSGINLTATGATLTAGDGPYPQTEQAGAEIGEFTNQSFESSTEGGLAVLKVPVTAFGGTSLTTSDTPVVLVQTSTHTTGLIEATIIEE